MAAALLIAASARADEGMWMLPLLQKMNAQAMKDLGCRLTPDQIYSINHSSLKDAVVQFGGGCTGELISDEGLLVTNHHCGYGTIQKLSTPEHNYLEDGYWAMNRSQELPAPGLSVTFLVSMTDVTNIIAKAEKKDPESVAEIIKDLEKKADADNPNCKSEVMGFYSNNVYYLLVYKTYTDVRFVGAPPASSGKFGGDTDNWMWPRHTCDFSMFRVYAGKDNEPAKYSEDNVPYTPKQSLKVSLKGIKDGDFSMIMGYPGSTQRYMTADQLEQMLDLQDISIAARTVRQDIMWKEMRADDKVGLQYASKYASSSNGWKKWIGEKQAFEKLGIIEREKEKEAELTEWINKKNKRAEKYGNAISDIKACTDVITPVAKRTTLLSESAYRIELVQMAGMITSPMARRMARPEVKDINPEEMFNVSKKMLGARYKDYSAKLDKKEAVALLNFYRDNAAKEDWPVIPGWDFATMDFEAYADYLFENSAFVSQEKMEAIPDMEAAKADPAAQLYQAINNVIGTFKYSDPDIKQHRAEASKTYTAALMEWSDGKPLYPDANFTMRLTYGNVKSYSPKDAVIYNYYTTLKGVMEKEDPDNYEFRVPARLKEIWETKDFGQYANDKGEMPACFLTNLDITGGNSGSPVLDADGALIGLAFDGNWEAMSSDVMFEPELQRCICVDIRYVLLMVDKFGGAGYLLDEMNILK